VGVWDSVGGRGGCAGECRNTDVRIYEKKSASVCEEVNTKNSR